MIVHKKITPIFCCIVEAATFKGKDSLENMRDTLKKHVRAAKNIMFEWAKEELLKQLRDLMVCDIL